MLFHRYRVVVFFIVVYSMSSYTTKCSKLLLTEGTLKWFFLSMAVCMYSQITRVNKFLLTKGALEFSPHYWFIYVYLNWKYQQILFGMNDILAWFLHCSYFYELRYNGVLYLHSKSQVCSSKNSWVIGTWILSLLSLDNALLSLIELSLDRNTISNDN